MKSKDFSPLNICLAAGLFLLSAAGFPKALGDGFRNPPEGANALSRAGGRIAFVDDASAVSHNPANLADLKDRSALASLTLGYASTEYTSPAGRTDETDDPWVLFPNVFAATPVADGKAVFGMGVTTPYGQSTRWEDDSQFRYTAPYFAELRAVDFKPTLALKLGDRVSVGAGLSVLYSDLDFRQYFPWSTVTGNPASPDGRAELEGDGTGFGGTAAVAWQIARRHRLAVTYRSPVEVEYEGDFRISNVPPPLGGLVQPRSDFETEIEFPTVVGFGYGFEPAEQWQIGVDVEWIEFSRFDALPLDVGVNNASGLLPPSISEQWDDTWTFGVGAQWACRPGLKLRAGYTFLESPIPDETLAPTLPDADRHVLSIGTGLNRKNHRLDLAYAYSLFEDREVRGNVNPAYDGDYELTAHLISVSYGLSF